MSANRGFTLLETGVVLGISLFSLAALVNLFITFNRVYGYEQVYTAVAGSAGRSVAAVEAAVLPARGVLASHAFATGIRTSGTTTLVLALPALDVSGAVVAGATDYVAFYASSTLLYRRIEAHPASVRTTGTTELSGTLSSVSFAYDAPNVASSTRVTVTLSTGSAYQAQTASTTLRQTFYLRNAP